MTTKKETTTSSAKRTPAKKSVTEVKAAGATATQQTKAARKDAAEKPAASPAAEAKVAVAGAKTVGSRKVSAEKPAAAPTRIMAHVDVGLGNTLFLRGEGGGLSWERGVPMECIGGNCWSWSAESVVQDITFKVLINDQQWSAGDNLTVAQGQTATFIPAF